ncbi:MAG: hypothetical protein ABR861_11680 [Terriglobales bacterium]
MRENTAHPYFRAVANSSASFKTRRRCSPPYPWVRASVPDSTPASRQISGSGVIAR